MGWLVNRWNVRCVFACVFWMASTSSVEFNIHCVDNSWIFPFGFTKGNISCQGKVFSEVRPVKPAHLHTHVLARGNRQTHTIYCKSAAHQSQKPRSGEKENLPRNYTLESQKPPIIVHLRQRYKEVSSIQQGWDHRKRKALTLTHSLKTTLYFNPAINEGIKGN